MIAEFLPSVCEQLKELNMFHLLTTLPQTAALNTRLFSKPQTRSSARSDSSTLPVTERCIPVRRRRARKIAPQGTNEQLRATWF